jgi:hypothetical protein
MSGPKTYTAKDIVRLLLGYEIEHRPWCKLPCDCGLLNVVARAKELLR